MPHPRIFFLGKLALISAFVVFVMVACAAAAPSGFEKSKVIVIPKSTSLHTATEILVKEHIVRSPFLLRVAVTLLGGRKGIAAGSYVFEKPHSVWVVAQRLIQGEHGLTPIKVTIPEGVTVTEIAWILLKNIPDFNAPYFVQIAHDDEGYLFPDTYKFYPDVTAEEVHKVLRTTFDKNIATLEMDVRLSKRKVSDIVIMASLLENEARTTTDRGIISGILWKRLDEGMPLQVDATLVYLTGRSSVSLPDTKIDSPYNTYQHKGLPPAPISNPGINALRAAAQSVKTPYYYYLSDAKGVMHYATTFAGHQVNREKYLNK